MTVELDAIVNTCEKHLQKCATENDPILFNYMKMIAEKLVDGATKAMFYATSTKGSAIMNERKTVKRYMKFYDDVLKLKNMSHKLLNASHNYSKVAQMIKESIIAFDRSHENLIRLCEGRRLKKIYTRKPKLFKLMKK